MKRTSIIGTITAKFDVLFEVLSEVIPYPGLRLKTRIIGEEINFSSPNLTIYVFSLDQKYLFSEGKDNYQFDCIYSENEPTVDKFLVSLTTALRKERISYVFEYSLIDDNGDWIGEEHSLRHPDSKLE